MPRTTKQALDLPLVAHRYSDLARLASPAIWETASQWYSQANEIATSLVPMLRTTYGKGDIETAAGILSAFSPRSHWQTNIRRAIQYASGQPVNTMRSHITMADRVMSTGIASLRGLKTNAFARAIAGDVDAIVIDTHMIQAAGLPHTYSPNATGYDVLASAVRSVARSFKVDGTTAQAAIWIVQRNGRAY